MLVALAVGDDAIGNVIVHLEPGAPGNGSVWASGRTRGGGRLALLTMGAGASERDWMAAIDRTKADIAPSVFGSGELRERSGPVPGPFEGFGEDDRKRTAAASSD
jgi:hypothetical protein